jgi:hypothetical protein
MWTTKTSYAAKQTWKKRATCGCDQRAPLADKNLTFGECKNLERHFKSIPASRVISFLACIVVALARICHLQRSGMAYGRDQAEAALPDCENVIQ